MNDVVDMTKDDVLADMSVLEDFERKQSTKPMRPIAWSIEKYEVAQLLALSGLSEHDVSKETKVPVSTIRQWKSHPEFRDYMNKITLEQADTFKALRLQLLSKIIDARVRAIEEKFGGDFSKLSAKDTVDLIAELRKETESVGGNEKTNFMSVISTLIEKSGALPFKIDDRERS